MAAGEQTKTPALPQETARELEFSRYYPKPSFLQESASNTVASPSLASPAFDSDRVPQPSYDATLTAFAQLGALRLDAKRAMISLIDRNSQYILAEATRTISLQSEDVCENQDKLWIGCATLPRAQGRRDHGVGALPFTNEIACAAEPPIGPIVINDLSKDDRFSGKPYVTDFPTLRFYVAIPIRTRSGFNIGAFYVTDDKPRAGLDHIELTFLMDMSTTIMGYLEMARVSREHHRAERMVKGIGLFVEGKSSLRDWGFKTERDQLTGESETLRQESTNKLVPGLGPDSSAASALTTPANASTQSLILQTSNLEVSPGDSSFSVLEEMPAGEMAAKERRDPTVESPRLILGWRESSMSTTDSSVNAEPFSTARQESSITSLLTSKESSSPRPSASEYRQPSIPKSEFTSLDIGPDLQNTMLSATLKDMFHRASNIIREAIEVDGTVFFDASIGTFGGNTSNSGESKLDSVVPTTERTYESAISSSEELHGTSPDDPGMRDGLTLTGSPAGQCFSRSLSETVIGKPEVQQKACEILGFATEYQTSLKQGDTPVDHLTIAETLLKTLLQRYPHGKIFNFDEKDSITDTEATVLQQAFPGVRNMVFFPLWDSHRERWFAGSFAWTTDSAKALTSSEDLSYLEAFGNSIMAEVARLDALAADRAKMDFISSVSHELRSPLHGILASVELLQETALDPFQDSMITTVKNCGRTLLDTINHVLDFAKINHFTKTQKSDSGRLRNRGQDRTSALQGRGPLGGMMSLSADIDLCVATEDAISGSLMGQQFRGVDSDVVADRQTLNRDQAKVIIDIESRSDWVFRTQPGAWRRILMDLFGNALKYTDATGFVKVSLRSRDFISVSTGAQQSTVTLSIADSGRGMSQEFLRTHLYTPFAQEDPLSPGTGLGLSIVRQIVVSLGGKIDIHSKQGFGTEAKVSFTLTRPPSPSRPVFENDESPPSIGAVRTRTRGLTLCLVGFDVYPDISESPTGILDVHMERSLLYKQSLERMATDWFGMKVITSLTLDSSPADMYIASETEDILLDLQTDDSGDDEATEAPLADASEAAPLIILCSNLSTYGTYVGKRQLRYNGKKIGVVDFVSQPCGPNKLAKSFGFCLDHVRDQHLFDESHTLIPGLSIGHSSFNSSFEASPSRMPSVQEVPIRRQNLFSYAKCSNIQIETDSLKTAMVDSSLLPGDFRRPPFLLSPSTSSADPSPFLAPATCSIAAVSSPAPDPAAVTRKPRPTLLLVEDNPINMELLVTFMTVNGYQSKMAGNGLLALQAYQDAPDGYDIIFMDISMPVMDGISSTRAIRSLERETKRKPSTIVALTGLASASAQQEAFSSGVNLFLTKPVSFKELRRILDEWTPGETTPVIPATPVLR